MSADKTITATTPVRTQPLPLELPGIHHMNDEETQAVLRVLQSKSLFRYYGVDLQNEVEAFEASQPGKEEKHG